MATSSTRSATRGRGRPPLITYDEIVALVEARLGEHWTLGSIATELGVSETALYYYFPNKAAILDAVCDRVMSDFQPPEFDGDVRSWLLDLGKAWYLLFTQHPILLDQRGWLPLVRPAQLEKTEQLLQTLTRAGFEPRDGMHVLFTVAAVGVQLARAATSGDLGSSVLSGELPPTLQEAVDGAANKPLDELLEETLSVALIGAVALHDQSRSGRQLGPAPHG